MHAVRVVVMLLLASCVADTSMIQAGCRSVTGSTEQVVSQEAGRLLVLPGVGNTRFHLASFVKAVEEQLPAFDVDVHRWGVRFMMLLNLRAYERNLATAQEIAAELTAWRREHPHDLLYIVGYSGGGGIALLVAEALPDEVTIDRLVLVAPAISPDYALDGVLPNVREFVVNYASDRDLQVGWGTRTFGTIDRVSTDSAGAVGFERPYSKLIEWRWSEEARALGHRGNHMSYLGRRWQDAHLLPALVPGLEPPELREAWSLNCGEDRG